MLFSSVASQARIYLLFFAVKMLLRFIGQAVNSLSNVRIISKSITQTKSHLILKTTVIGWIL